MALTKEELTPLGHELLNIREETDKFLENQKDKESVIIEKIKKEYPNGFPTIDISPYTISIASRKTYDYGEGDEIVKAETDLKTLQDKQKKELQPLKDIVSGIKKDMELDGTAKIKDIKHIVVIRENKN